MSGDGESLPQDTQASRFLGGTPNEVLDLRAAGFMSTGHMCRQLGVQMVVSEVIALGITPRIKLRAGHGVYWAPEQLRDVRRALILKLLAQEFAP